MTYLSDVYTIIWMQRFSPFDERQCLLEHPCNRLMRYQSTYNMLTQYYDQRFLQKFFQSGNINLGSWVHTNLVPYEILTRLRLFLMIPELNHQFF